MSRQNRKRFKQDVEDLQALVSLFANAFQQLQEALNRLDEFDFVSELTDRANSARAVARKSKRLMDGFIDRLPTAASDPEQYYSHVGFYQCVSTGLWRTADCLQIYVSAVRLLERAQSDLSEKEEDLFHRSISLASDQGMANLLYLRDLHRVRDGDAADREALLFSTEALETLHKSELRPIWDELGDALASRKPQEG
jgi:hypothetical protein